MDWITLLMYWFLSTSSIYIFLVFFPIFWDLNHTLRYYVKMVLFDAWLMIGALLMIPVIMWTPGNVKNVRTVQNFIQLLFPLFGVKLELRNLENLECDKPRVIVCNHQSTIDMVGMMAVMPDRSVALLKKELLYAGPFGLVAWLCGLIFVDRSNREQAKKTMENVAERMQERNLNVWIYPEGTRNHENQLLPFKKGAFQLAIQAKVPIYPIVFSSYRDFLSKKDKVFKTGMVIVTCLPAVSTEGLTLDDVTILTDRVRESMQTVYNSTSQEVHDRAKLRGKSILVENHH